MHVVLSLRCVREITEGQVVSLYLVSRNDASNRYSSIEFALKLHSITLHAINMFHMLIYKYPVYLYI